MENHSLLPSSLCAPIKIFNSDEVDFVYAQLNGKIQNRNDKKT